MRRDVADADNTRAQNSAVLSVAVTPVYRPLKKLNTRDVVASDVMNDAVAQLPSVQYWRLSPTDGTALSHCTSDT